tara:strand:- start:357 stop:569 length:213 start_codon:yes stop_codon:yes gene_type:complete
MKYLLGLCIFAVGLCGITLAVLVREHFSDVMYKDFSMFITSATLFFPVLAVAVIVLLIKTIQVINSKDRG